MYLVGVDEAGRGPVIGPMVVCALGVHESKIHLLKDMGIRDSKKLSPKRREFLAGALAGFSRHAMRVIRADEIDRMRMTMTMNELEVELFSEVIAEIIGLCQDEDNFTVYLDSADVDEDRFGRDVGVRVVNALASSNRAVAVSFTSRHGADDLYPIVGAASIMAKVRRDAEVGAIAEELSKALPSLPLGSGYPSDPRTMNFIRAYIERYGALPPHVRRSWKTVKRLAKEFALEYDWHKERGQRSLFEF